MLRDPAGVVTQQSARIRAGAASSNVKVLLNAFDIRARRVAGFELVIASPLESWEMKKVIAPVAPPLQLGLDARDRLGAQLGICCCES